MHIKVDNIDSSIQIKKKFLKSPEHLQKILDTVLESEKSENVTDIIFRMGCFLLYEGFTSNEVLELTKDNVNFDTGIIESHDKSKIIKISDILKKLIEQTIDTDETIRVIRGGTVAQVPLENSDKLIRRIYMKNNVESNIDYFRARLAKIKKDYEKENFEAISLAPNRIYLSGIFYRLYEKEKRKESLTDNDFKFNIKEDISEQSKLIKMYRNKQDYNDWKKAYDFI